MACLTGCRTDLTTPVEGDKSTSKLQLSQTTQKPVSTRRDYECRVGGGVQWRGGGGDAEALLEWIVNYFVLNIPAGVVHLGWPGPVQP